MFSSAASKTDEPLVCANQLEVAFTAGRSVLQGVQLTIREGEFVSLLGPSGCGKSTLLKLIAGLISPTGGSITVGGQRPEMSRRTTHPMAYVFQDATLLPWRTVTENIRLPLELQGTWTAKDSVRIDQVLELVGLKPTDATKRPQMLSGGMRMRVSLARALITQPRLLLLDEPFAALDDVLRQQLNEELVRIWQDRGWTGVFVTHNVAEAVFLSQRVMILSANPGRVASEISIPFPYPRTAELRATAEFGRLSVELTRRLRETSS